MATAATIALGFLLIVSAEQCLAVAYFVLRCRRKAKALGNYAPNALVVLPVRGADSTLARCVAGLATQDYENYRVRIVFDSHQDPGWQIVDRVLDEHPGAPIEMMQLESPRTTCSLKCSAIYEATEDLDDAEVVAQLDTDVVPHSSWLRELVQPLSEPSVGVAHGNRWYLPETASWGALLRYFWNAAAVPTMFFWSMPWGGTLAVKRSLLEQTDVRQRWLRAGCEDVPLGIVAKKNRMQVRFVPSLLMLDRSDTTMERCLPFVDRQLLWVRLYHPACWWASNAWQVLIAVAMLVAAVGLGVGLMTMQASLLVVCLAALVVPSSVSLGLVAWIEQTLVPNESGPVRRRGLNSLLALALTNVAMTRSIFVSLFAKAITWRRIEYHIRGAWDIEMNGYRPYDSAAQEPASVEVGVGHVSESVS